MDNSTVVPNPTNVTSVAPGAGNPVVAFVIGLGIILLASVLNAAGLNLTKLDHVRTSAIPKADRRKDWLRPLWLLGMMLYILSQLIGSTLALEYMRAEYVAPLGSSSLIFNFLFARFLVGTPVTSNDIYGTIVVILGVVGIVAFGSINSGLASETDVAHLTTQWRRGGWLGYFFVMSLALILLLIFTSSLDAILAARSDIQALPFSGINTSRQKSSYAGGWLGKLGKVGQVILWIREMWSNLMGRIAELLETWSAPKDDKQVAWTLGIGWACCGGGLAGGCLVFTKATVKLLSGSLSHQNPGNQFGHVAPIFTIILLSITAVVQIVCLNRGLKVYDSTLVVPVFYGVYTATGFLNSLIFNNDVDAYKSWTLFLIFASILVLISGVVLLTHKKPEPVVNKVRSTTAPRRRTKNKNNSSKTKLDDSVEGEEGEGEDQVLWSLGDVSDDERQDEDEDIDHHQHPLYQPEGSRQRTGTTSQDQRKTRKDETDEEEGLMSSGRQSIDSLKNDHNIETAPLR